MPHPVFREGARALITGAGSGIGLAVSKMCASHSMHVTMVDIDSSRLENAQDEVKQAAKGSVPVETHSMDVSKLSDWEALHKKVPDVDLLMLNAGIGLKSDWTDNAYFHKIFDVNYFGVVNGVSTYYPDFKEKSKWERAIVITGSKQGITNPPGNPAYNASKAAVRATAEHLSYDLKDSNTSVHLLVPGWTFTGLTGGGKTKEKPKGAWSPEQVAEYLYNKMENRKFYVICPDNDVTEEMDKKRMQWGVGDIVHERQPLSRWREEYKEENRKWMDNPTL